MLEDDENYNQTQIKTFLDNLKSTSISVDNYTKFFENSKNMDRIIISQIESSKYEYTKIQKALKLRTDSEAFKERYNKKIVSIEDFQLLYELNQKRADVITWISLQQEMKHIMIEKFNMILGDVNAMQIKKESLSEFREMNKEQRGFFIELFNNKYEQLNDKINYLQSKQLDFFKDLVEKILDKKDDYVKELQKLTEKYEDVRPFTPKNPPIKVIKEVDESVKDILDDEDDDDLGEDDTDDIED